MQGQPAVSVQGIEIAFGAVRVLEKLDLDIADEEFLVLLGPSGCGKSTLLNAIAGLIDVKAGKIFIGGTNVTWAEPKDRGVGMVFQSYALYPRMTVKGNMTFGVRMAGLPAPEIERRLAAAAQMLKITDLLDRKPSQLSGGQRQRVAIGRALVREAKVFLFDEPLSNLDAQLRAELRVEIKRLHQRLKATMIYVTHDQIEAMTLADRVAVMKDRIIQQLGSPKEIYNRPVNRFVASFVGSPAMCFLPGRLEKADGGIRFVGDGLTVPLDAYEFSTTPEDGAPAELGVRPEHLHETADGTPLVVEMIEPMGSDQLAWLKVGGTTFSMRLPAEAAVHPGDTLHVGVPARKISLFDVPSGRRI